MTAFTADQVAWIEIIVALVLVGAAGALMHWHGVVAEEQAAERTDLRATEAHLDARAAELDQRATLSTWTVTTQSDHAPSAVVETTIRRPHSSHATSVRRAALHLVVGHDTPVDAVRPAMLCPNPLQHTNEHTWQRFDGTDVVLETCPGRTTPAMQGADR